jgi:hypothetical protein
VTVAIAHQLLAAHEAGHAVARVTLRLGVGAISLREDGSGATERRPEADLVRLAESQCGADGLSALERELIACHAGHVAEARWYAEELILGPDLPQESHGDAEAIRYLISRFPGQVTPAMRRETEALAYALVDDHWPAVRRLVEALCRHRLPVSLPGSVVTRLIESASGARVAQFEPSHSTGLSLARYRFLA